MVSDGTMIQVTKFQRTVGYLEPWAKFLKSKRIKTEVRKAPKDGYLYSRFALWRSLTAEEVAGIKSGKYVILNNLIGYNPSTKVSDGSSGRKCWGWSGTRTRKARKD